MIDDPRNGLLNKKNPSARLGIPSYELLGPRSPTNKLLFPLLLVPTRVNW